MWTADRLCRVAAACRDSPLPVALTLLAGLLILACGEDGREPTFPTTDVAEVVVASPIGTLIAVGRTVQLSAEARNGLGNVIPDVSFAWRSSNAGVATVDAVGLVTGVAPGTVAITATAEGTPGSLDLRLVAADLSTVSDLLADPFVDRIVSHLSDSARTDMQSALVECSGYVNDGNLAALEQCLEAASGQADAASDSTDRVLLTVLSLIFEQAERLLNL